MINVDDINRLVEASKKAEQQNNYAKVDYIGDILSLHGVVLSDKYRQLGWKFTAN